MAATLLLAACSGYTTSASNVSATSATLNGDGGCAGGNTNASGTPCSWYWEWGTVASGGFANTSPIQGPVNGNTHGNVAFSFPVANLTPSTAYQYELCGKGDNTNTYVCAGKNDKGNGIGNGSDPSTFTTAAAGSLPPGVTLKAIDGGPSYYCSHGFTNACSAGWDKPSFFPVGVWYGRIIQQADVTRWKDLGLNTLFRTDQYTNLPLVKSGGLYAIVDDEGSPETPGMGSETVGLLASDEPPNMSAFTNSLATTPNSQQDGRFWYLNNTWDFVQYGGLSPVKSSSQVLSTLVATPNGSKRHDDTQSVDLYWFAGAKATNANNFGLLYEGGLLYGLGVNGSTGTSSMTLAQAECGCRYGDMVDSIRAFQTTYPAPIAQFVEDGGPYTQDTSGADYITPPELNWSVWSSIVHGARQVIYFNHTFGGPASVSDDNFAAPYFQTVQPGQTISIYDQAKATDGLIAALAPEINAPQALGYVTTKPGSSTFSGIETRATDDNGAFTIFADTRDAENTANIPVTFTTADGYSGSVTVTGENRTVQATNGVFTDTFAHGSTVHIYQIP